jgi:hypothetical protein
MTTRPRLEVVKETNTGLNQQFKDNKTGAIMSRAEVVKKIDQFPDYHVMRINDKNVIRSNPDSSKRNNLD